MGDLRGFPVWVGLSDKEKEPVLGVFSLMSVIPVFYTFQRKRNKTSDHKIWQRNRRCALAPLFCRTYNGMSNGINLKFFHNLNRAKLTAHCALCIAISEVPCPCRVKSALYLTFPIERRPHQCDLFVVSHVFVFYRVADMRSNPEGDEAFFD
jgi:hypothetical protein